MLTVAAFLNCTPDVKFIIAFQKAPVNDVEDVPLVFHPILADKLGCDTFKLFCQVVFRRRSKPLSERLGHRRLMLRAKLPQKGGGGNFFRRPVSEMSNTYRSRGFSRELSTRAMPLEPRRTYRRMVSFQRSYSAQAVASGRWAKIISCSWKGYLYSREAGGKKCRPSLPAIRQVGGGVAGHRRIKFQVTHHRHCPRCQNPGTVPARQMLHRSWRTALKGAESVSSKSSVSSAPR